MEYVEETEVHGSKNQYVMIDDENDTEELSEYDGVYGDEYGEDDDDVEKFEDAVDHIYKPTVTIIDANAYDEVKDDAFDVVLNNQS